MTTPTASPADQSEYVRDMLDRIIASMETMTRPMMLDWLKRERSALAAAHSPTRESE